MAKYKVGDTVGIHKHLLLEYLDPLIDNKGRKIRQGRFLNSISKEEFVATILEVETSSKSFVKKIDLSKVLADNEVKDKYIFYGDNKINVTQCYSTYISNQDKKYYHQIMQIVTEIMQIDAAAGSEFITALWNLYYNYNKTWQWLLTAMLSKTAQNWAAWGAGLLYYKPFCAHVHQKLEQEAQKNT